MRPGLSLIRDVCVLVTAGSVAANNQPSAEGQDGYRAAQRQQIGGVVHFEANALFQRSDNQANNHHIGQIVFQALQVVHRAVSYTHLTLPTILLV